MFVLHPKDTAIQKFRSTSQTISPNIRASYFITNPPKANQRRKKKTLKRSHCATTHMCSDSDSLTRSKPNSRCRELPYHRHRFSVLRTPTPSRIISAVRFAHASRCQKIASRVEPCVHALLLTHTPKEPKERTQFGGAAKKWHRTRERARARARIVPNVLEVGWRVSVRGNSRTITQSARRDCSGSGVRELQRRDAATREGATFFYSV